MWVGGWVKGSFALNLGKNEFSAPQRTQKVVKFCSLNKFSGAPINMWLADIIEAQSTGV